MHTIKGLPVFEALLTDSACGMHRISLVDLPAVEKDFLAFGKKVQTNYAVADADKQIVFGVIMRANFPIYRIDAQMGEYWIVYSAATLRQMAEKYLFESRQNRIDLDHDGKEIEGVNMTQIFIKDSAKGISPVGFEDIEDGSIFGEFHVTDAQTWAAIKDGTYKGFSLEGMFAVEPAERIISEEKIPAELMSWLESFEKDFDFTKINMANTIKTKLAALLAKFGAVTTDKGALLWEGDEDLTIGMEVFQTGEDGEKVAAEDGEYTLEDGTIVAVAEGKVTDINAPANNEPEGEPQAEPEVEAEGEEPEGEPEGEPEVDKVAELEQKVADLTAKVADLEEKLEQILAMFKSHKVSKPAHEEFKAEPQVKGFVPVGNAKLDAFARRMRE